MSSVISPLWFSSKIWLSLGILSVCSVLLAPYQLFQQLCVEAFCAFPAERTSCFSINCFFHALFFLRGASSCLSLPWNLRPPWFVVELVFLATLMVVLFRADPPLSSKPEHGIFHASCVALVWGLQIPFPPLPPHIMGSTVELSGCFSWISIGTENSPTAWRL